MNKILKTMMLAAVTAFGLASCEDVPAPFIEPEMPGAGGGEDITLPYTSANLKDGFEVYTPTGNAWSLGNTYAKATGYNSGSTTASETYLISPAIPLGDAEQVYVDFKYVIAYTNSLGLEEGHQVLVCTEYNTEAPASSNWIKLPFEPKEREDRNSWDMYSANTMSIPADMLGKEIRIAFLYKCNSNSASTWELTNLSVSTEPGGEITPDDPETPDTPADGGTWDKPYTVAQAIANQTGEEVWVHGYIVGSIPADAAKVVLENMTFTADGASGTNLCIADVPNETNYANCAPVQLPAGSDARTDLNLMNNPSKLGVEVWLKGKTVKYCGAPGLKEISKYTLTAPTAEDDQEPSEEPTEDPKGDGSLENPYNVSAVMTLYANGNPEGQSVYVKGKISKIKSLDVSQWERAQYFISDDGTENAQFQIYNGYYLDGKPFTSNDQIKVGDEVIVYGELSSYQGTPQIGQNSKIVSINGQTGDGDTPGDDEGEGDQEDDDLEEDTGSNVSNFKASDLGLSNGTAFSEVTVQGVTISVDGGGNQNSPKYYNNGSNLRMYPQNEITFSTERTIKRIKLTCTSGYVASGDVETDKGTTSVEDPIIIINDIYDKTLTLTNTSTNTGAPSQVRIEQFEITYAE